MSELTLGPWNILGPEAAPKVAAPEPSEQWTLGTPEAGGFALVYRAPGHDRLEKPVIFADGFNAGPSQPDAMWEHMEAGRGGYNLVTELWNRGNDVILLGYNERSASILVNANVAIECITQAAGGLTGDARMAVGGFSMGGLVTRYALAKMERDGDDHKTEVYFSWDSPHRGAWIPISLQALAHFLKEDSGIDAMSDHINSDAARQLLWRHIDTLKAEPEEDPMRREFLDALAEVGGWPSRPVKVGVANGSGQGENQGIPAGAECLKVTGALHPMKGTTLYGQASGDDKLVAELRRGLILIPYRPAVSADVRTSGLPELDNAPGGTLETFGIARDELAKLGGVECAHEWVDFVPTVSAVAIRDLDSPDLYTNIGNLPRADSELNEFFCASGNEEHSLVTAELANWLLARLPK